MLAAIGSAAVVGVDAYEVTVEVDLAPGLPQWTVVGLAAGAVRESRDRVLAALVNSGFQVPTRRVTVNLAPADVRKEGSAFDLPLALGVLVASGQLPAESTRHLVAVGELSLDGALRPVRGILPIATGLGESSERTLVVPPGNLAEARLARRRRVASPDTLAQLVRQLADGALPEPAPAPEASPPADLPDLTDVAGQPAARRALEIAAAGDHGMIMIGPPGSGKTLLARCLPGILPRLTEAEALETLAIQSVAGLLGADRLPAAHRPFRAPHHTVSVAGLVGGGPGPRPGEVSLAHRGVLFLDELLEFPRHTLDAMRQPLEDGFVVIARAAGTVRFPARFTVVGAMNPCPCGWAGDVAGRCVCAAAEIRRYRGRLSGPLADRIDLHLGVQALPVSELSRSRSAEASSAVRMRVEAARDRQRVRYRSMGPVVSNGGAPGRWLDRETPIAPSARALLVRAAERMGLSARAYHRVLRVARTVADLDGAEAIEPAAVAEALRYRPAGCGGA